MDRNWLIRTTQNQILGPVAKQKLLEFIEKGALGLNDEVASGNGYWFALREKDLVEKYIYGDIPQGYNPISESKSVLFKRENPEKTSSINTAPANKTASHKIPNYEGPVTLPKADDLEFPDLETMGNSPATTSTNAAGEVTKLPAQDDLEFPDMSMMPTSSPSQFSDGHGMQTEVQHQPTMTPIKREPISNYTPGTDEVIVYPKDEDLDFPDLNAAPPVERDKTFEFTVNLNSTQTIAIKSPMTTAPETAEESVPLAAPAKKVAKKAPMEIDAGEDLGELTLTMAIPTKDLKSELKENPVQKKREREIRDPKEHKEERLLHDRKTKAPTTKVPVRENREVVSIENAPTPLKKRNDNYIFFILIIVALIMLAVFFYFREILNKPLPV